MYIKRLLQIIFLTIMLNGIGFSQSSGLGIGAIVGEPNGLNMKMWSTQNTALEFVIAYSLVFDNLYGHADYLIHNFSLIQPAQGQAPVFFGIGANLIASEEPAMGIRIPLGIAYLFANAPLDIFAQVVPTVGILPGTGFDLGGGIGGRFYF